MSAIYIEYYVGGGAVRNLADGADVRSELERAKAENPGKRCWVIGSQSFDSETNGRPDYDMMPGY